MVLDVRKVREGESCLFGARPWRVFALVGMYLRVFRLDGRSEHRSRKSTTPFHHQEGSNFSPSELLERSRKHLTYLKRQYVAALMTDGQHISLLKHSRGCESALDSAPFLGVNTSAIRVRERAADPVLPQGDELQRPRACMCSIVVGDMHRSDDSP